MSVDEPLVSISGDYIEGADYVVCEECGCHLLLDGWEAHSYDWDDEPGRWLAWTCDLDSCEDYASRWVSNPYLRCYGDLRRVHPDEV